MGLVAYKIIQAASGNSGDITGELIEAKNSGTLVTAPQAGDLLIGNMGLYTTAVVTYSPYIQVIRAVSSPWYGSYTESSNIVYKIATGSEGTTQNMGNGNKVIGVYRFSSPVTSVSVAFSTTQQGSSTRTITTSSYDKPHIVVCSVGSYQDPSLTMTNSDYSLRGGYCDAAASLRNSDSSLTNAVISMTNVSFNEACSYAVLVPNFD
jgi:hypothetical protein